MVHGLVTCAFLFSSLNTKRLEQISFCSNITLFFFFEWTLPPPFPTGEGSLLRENSIEVLSNVVFDEP